MNWIFNGKRNFLKYILLEEEAQDSGIGSCWTHVFPWIHHSLLKKIQKLDEMRSTTKEKSTMLSTTKEKMIQVQEAETQPWQKPYIQSVATHNGKGSQHRRRRKGLVPNIGHSSCWHCTGEKSPQNTWFRKETGLMSRVPKCYKKLRSPFKGLLEKTSSLKST